MSTNRVGFGDGTIRTTEQLMAGARGELRRLSSELQTEIGQLQGRFGGQAAVALGNLNAAWDEKHSRIVSTLERFEASLSTTEKTMTANDEESSAALATIQARMQG